MVVTASFSGGAEGLVCRTRDVSVSGVFLETPAPVDPGTPVNLVLLDEQRGEAIDLAGEVARVVPASPSGAPGGLGIRLYDVPDAWVIMVDGLVNEQRVRDPTLGLKLKRLRILVVGDEPRRRGALALYVKSGWDIRFASDLMSAREALEGFKIDAVIAEHDLHDGRWPPLLSAVKDAQPAARRIVRAKLDGQLAPPPGGPQDLVHRVVDLDAGLDALVDALAADWSPGGS
jgi:hypothetical protein